MTNLTRFLVISFLSIQSISAHASWFDFCFIKAKKPQKAVTWHEDKENRFVANVLTLYTSLMVAEDILMNSENIPYEVKTHALDALGNNLSKEIFDNFTRSRHFGKDRIKEKYEIMLHNASEAVRSQMIQDLNKGVNYFMQASSEIAPPELGRRLANFVWEQILKRVVEINIMITSYLTENNYKIYYSIDYFTFLTSFADSTLSGQNVSSHYLYSDRQCINLENIKTDIKKELKNKYPKQIASVYRFIVISLENMIVKN